jgi:hypothetical protein
MNIDYDDLAERHATRPISALLGPRPFLEGEDIAGYYGLAERVRQGVQPMDVFEEIWAREIVDLIWERLRWSRLRDELLDASVHQGLSLILSETMHPHDADSLRLQWCAKWPQAVETVKRLVAGLPDNALRAHTLAARLDEIERIDAMAMRCEQRRNSALREIARHRETFAERLRDVSQTIASEAKEEE